MLTEPEDLLPLCLGYRLSELVRRHQWPDLLLEEPDEAFLSLPDGQAGLRVKNLAQGVPDGSGFRRPRQCGNLGRQAFRLGIFDIQRH
jgi:hypothetical protein